MFRSLPVDFLSPALRRPNSEPTRRRSQRHITTQLGQSRPVVRRADTGVRARLGRSRFRRGEAPAGRARRPSSSRRVSSRRLSELRSENRRLRLPYSARSLPEGGRVRHHARVRDGDDVRRPAADVPARGVRRRRAMSAPVPRVLRELRGRDCAGVGRLRGPIERAPRRRGFEDDRIFQTDGASERRRASARYDSTRRETKSKKRFVAFAAHAFEPVVRGEANPRGGRRHRERARSKRGVARQRVGRARTRRQVRRDGRDHVRVDTHGRARRVYVRSVTRAHGHGRAHHRERGRRVGAAASGGARDGAQGGGGVQGVGRVDRRVRREDEPRRLGVRRDPPFAQRVGFRVPRCDGSRLRAFGKHRTARVEKEEVGRDGRDGETRARPGSNRYV